MSILDARPRRCRRKEGARQKSRPGIIRGGPQDSLNIWCQATLQVAIGALNQRGNEIIPPYAFCYGFPPSRGAVEIDNSYGARRKSIASDARYARRNRYACKRFASRKCAPADARYARGNRYAFKRCASRKRILANTRHTIRNCYIAFRSTPSNQNPVLNYHRVPRFFLFFLLASYAHRGGKCERRACRQQKQPAPSHIFLHLPYCELQKRRKPGAAGILRPSGNPPCRPISAGNVPAEPFYFFTLLLLLVVLPAVEFDGLFPRLGPLLLPVVLGIRPPSLICEFPGFTVVFPIIGPPSIKYIHPPTADSLLIFRAPLKSAL